MIRLVAERGAAAARYAGLSYKSMWPCQSNHIYIDALLTSILYIPVLESILIFPTNNNDNNDLIIKIIK